MPSDHRPPEIRPITQLTLPDYESGVLPNGMQLYLLKGGSEPVMKVEIVFRAGAWYESKPGCAEFAAGLLSEGTKKMSSATLAEYIESKGATIQTRGGVDTIRIRLYTLTRYLPELMEVLTDIISQPAFDEEELKVYTENKIERLTIDLKKNEVLAYRYLTESFYGRNHPYGRNVKPSDYQQISTADLHAHHQQWVKPNHGMVFVSGSFGAREVDLLQHTLGTWQPGTNHDHADDIIAVAESKHGVIEVDGPQSHQAAIRMGRRLFPQSNPDFNGLYVVNTILGGYFGSRLMTEIRENQGLTYGIYSSIDSFARDGCFYISTETATGNIPKMTTAIQDEVNKLRTELVPEDELQMARNYLMGHVMTQLDGPFSSLDFIKALKIEGLEDEHFKKMVSTILHITPLEIRALADQYLDPAELVTIIVR